MNNNKVSWKWLGVSSAALVVLMVGGVLGYLLDVTKQHQSLPWHYATGIRMDAFELQLERQEMRLEAIRLTITEQTGVLREIRDSLGKR
jgi:hypothetical protein